MMQGSNRVSPHEDDSEEGTRPNDVYHITKREWEYIARGRAILSEPVFDKRTTDMQRFAKEIKELYHGAYPNWWFDKIIRWRS